MFKSGFPKYTWGGSTYWATIYSYVNEEIKQGYIQMLKFEFGFELISITLKCIDFKFMDF